MLLLFYFKAFLKTKRDLELVSLSHFLYDFWRKIFIVLYSVNWANFSVWLLFLLEILDILQYVYCNYLFSSLQKFKTSKILKLLLAFFHHADPRVSLWKWLFQKFVLPCNYNWMEQLRFRYKKFGAFQETFTGSFKTFCK